MDYQNDEDHNRAVVTVVGEPEQLTEAVIEAMGIAIDIIDMRQHQGQHPRMGAIDVVPFIPVKNVSPEEAVASGLMAEPDKIALRRALALAAQDQIGA